MPVTRFPVFGLLSLAVFFAQSSCRSKPPVHKEIIYDSIKTIKVDSATEKVKVSSIIDSIGYVRLGASPVPISFVDRCICLDHHIVILDGQVARSVFIFDQNGAFQRTIQIGREGKIIRIADICVDKENKVLYVYAGSENKIFSYDISTGAKINEIKIAGSFRKISHLNDKFILIRDQIFQSSGDPGINNPNRIGVFDKKGTFLYGFLNKSIFEMPENGSLSNIECAFNNSIKISQAYSDTLYELRAGNMYALYNLSLLHKNLPHPPILSDTLSEQNYLVWEPVLENKRFMFLNYAIESQFYTLICDKQSGQFKLIRIILNDIDHIPLSRHFFDINDKRIAEVVYPLELLSVRDHSIVNSAKAEKLYELCQGLSAQSNPVIRYLYFRK